MNLPRGVLSGPNLGIFADALKKFGRITRENEQDVKAWIRAEREKRGLDSPHYVPPANVTPFRDVVRLESEDGWK